MKTKFLSLLLVLCIVVGCTGITALASTDAKINLTEDFGEINISLTGANTYGGELIVGFYDQFDKACMVKNYKAYDGITCSLTAPDNAERVKVMWVKSFKSLKPVCPPAEKEITKATVTEIDVALIETHSSNISNGYIEYYESVDAIKSTKIYVTPTAPVYINGVLYSDGFDAALSVSSYKDATVKFIENTSDMYCDIIDFTICDYYYVEEVNTSADRIVFGGTYGKSVTFTDFLEDPSYNIEFKDKNGNNIEIADFKAGDVVGVVAADVGKCKPSPTNNIVTYYNLGENSVTGMITALNISKNTVWINEKEYGVIDKTVGTSTGFKLGDEGKYLLTKTGKVFDFNGSLAKNYKVAYVLDAYYDNSGINADTVQFQLLTADQDIVIVDANSTFTYAKADGTGVANATVKTAGATIENIYKANGSATMADRIVKYKLNSDNYLRSIEAFGDANTVVNTYYNKDFLKIGKYNLAEETKIFVINNANLVSSYVTDLSALNEENTYHGIVAGRNDDYTYSLAVFDEADMHHVDKAQGIAVVGNVIPTIYKGEEATMMTVYSDNDAVAKTLYFTDDSCKYPGSGVYAYNMVNYYKVNAGSVILYTANEKGLVSDYIVLATYDVANSVLVPDVEGLSSASGVTADNTEYSYTFGFIDKFVDGKITIKNTGDIYRASGNMYTFGYKAIGSTVIVDDYTAGNVDIYENGKANFVFLKLENGRVTDIYTISNRAIYTPTIITQSTDLK